MPGAGHDGLLSRNNRYKVDFIKLLQSDSRGNFSLFVYLELAYDSCHGVNGNSSIE